MEKMAKTNAIAVMNEIAIFNSDIFFMLRSFPITGADRSDGTLESSAVCPKMCLAAYHLYDLVVVYATIYFPSIK